MTTEKTTVRDKLGILIIERDGGVAVQLFAEPDRAYGAFKEMRGKIGEKEWRATFIDLRWDGGMAKVGKCEGRELPMARDEVADGYVLGEGPLKLKK